MEFLRWIERQNHGETDLGFFQMKIMFPVLIDLNSRYISLKLDNKDDDNTSLKKIKRRLHVWWFSKVWSWICAVVSVIFIVPRSQIHLSLELFALLYSSKTVFSHGYPDFESLACIKIERALSPDIVPRSLYQLLLDTLQLLLEYLTLHF